jgi:tRNA threonylcarbamoyladenosine biosynthesis protein TsaE
MKFSKEQLPRVAEGLVAYAAAHSDKKAFVIALEGDLGAGKTTLTQHIARALGVAQTPPSPTFVILRSYKTAHPAFLQLVHIDAYRLDDESELPPLRLGEVFESEGTLVCVEWPQKLGAALPASALHITLRYIGEETRELSANADTEGYLQKMIQVV